MRAMTLETEVLVVEAKRLKAEAKALKARAAAANRVARVLNDKGYSTSEAAFIMGISRQRLHQLLAWHIENHDGVEHVSGSE